MASNNTELEVRSEVAKGATTWDADGSRVATRTGGVTKDEEGPVGECGQGSSDVDTRLIPTPGTEVAEDADLTLTTF